MNEYEQAVSRFANDLSAGVLVPSEEESFDGIKFTLNNEQFEKDCDTLSKLEYLLRHGRAHICIEND